jgi:asparagine synthase (glutamine-hydrolysing)
MADGAYSGEKMHAAICQFLALRQIGEMHTKLSLSTGVLVRDPTKDRRIVEFCLNIPIEQFQKAGEERRLISVYMKNIVPPHIISERRIGVQSSDIKYRLQECWPDILEYCAELFRQDQPDSLIDGVKIRNDIQRFMKTAYADIGQQDIVRLIYTALAKEYMDRTKK